MDPRPYDFSYRKPRKDNLTYQSYGLSESLFHIGAYNKKFNLPKPKNIDVTEKLLNSNPQSLIHNHGSRWNVKQQNLSNSYIYSNPSSFSNYQTRVTKQKLSKSLVMQNSRLLDQKQITDNIKRLRKQKIKNQADSLSNWTYEQIKPKIYNIQEGQDRVFEHQQKPYNIINFKPKNQLDPHRPYQKFSLQHLLPPQKRQRGN